MIKQLGSYLVGFAMISFTGFYIHNILSNQLVDPSSISLKKAYTFFGGFSLLLCVNFLLVSKTKKFKEQLGFLYLVGIGLKLILFCIVFNEHIFTKDSFTKQESLNLLIPMILTLILEVFFISKILKNTSHSKNTK